MASTQAGVSDEKSEDTSVRKRRFVAVPVSSEPDSGDEATQSETAPKPLMRKRAAIGGVAMGAASLLFFVVAAGFSGGAATISDEKAAEVFALREEIKTAETATEALPDVPDAERALVTAQVSATEIAGLQNDYRHLTPAVAASDGVLPTDRADSILRNLAPYFAPSVDQSLLSPWYLLASDKDIPSGSGLPMSFDSGFEWVAQRPYTITQDSTVRVIWLAVETRPAEGQDPAVLAWAQADYDLTRKTFFSIEFGTTATGEALRQEVRGS